MNGWTFLVARGRHKGYRTVLAPDFLVVRNLHSLLSASAGGDSPEVGGRRAVEIDNREIGQLLDEIGTSVRVAAETARKYPNDSGAQDLAARPTWEPVGAEYVGLLDVVAPVA